MVYLNGDVERVYEWLGVDSSQANSTWIEIQLVYLLCVTVHPFDITVYLFNDTVQPFTLLFIILIISYDTVHQLKFKLKLELCIMDLSQARACIESIPMGG